MDEENAKKQREAAAKKVLAMKEGAAAVEASLQARRMADLRAAAAKSKAVLEASEQTKKKKD
jgi:hypothetical protein